jgi:hypothetical protein
VPRSATKSVVETLERRRLLAASYFVSVDGDDVNPGTDPAHAWRHIQKAFDAATPGSTVTVLPGRYNEKLVLNVSGNATDGFITFQAQGKVVISGKKLPGADVISINNRSYVKIVGFDIRDNRNVNNGSGIRLSEANSFIEIRNNRITKITGRSAMGITVYGTNPAAGISNLVIDGNEVFKCQPFPSEAVVLNGNVHDFTVTNNYVHHVNNIAMDFIGGEGRSPNPATDFARNGVVSGNRITRASARGGGRDVAGIYVDGAENIVVERNLLWRNDVGIEVNAIQPSRVARGVVVRDNVVANNNFVGLSVGGSDLATGSVQGCSVTHNTLYSNDTRRTGNGELRVQNALGNVFRNNLVSSQPGTLLVNVQRVAGNNDYDHNLYFTPGRANGGRFAWRGRHVNGLDAFKVASLAETNSLFADPLLANSRQLDFHLTGDSPAIDTGDPLFVPAPNELDVDGEARVAGGRVDIGADEAA